MRAHVFITASLVALGVLLMAPAGVLAAAPCPAGICIPVPQPTLPIGMHPAPSPSPSPSPSPVVPPGPTAPPVPLTPNDNLQAIGQWVFAGANWSVCLIPRLLDLQVDAIKCPPDQALTVKLPEPKDWFAPLYRRSVEIAGLLMLPLLLLAFLQALIRQDVGMALRAAFGFVPLAVILSAVAVSLTQALLAVTDSLSNFMLDGYQGQVAGAIGSLAGVLAAGSAGSVFTVGGAAAAVIAALVAIFAGLAIFIELIARQALIYAAVLFLPLGFAGMVWPRLWAWTQRLVEVVVIAVVSKFFIVSVLVLGAAAFTSAGGGGPFDSQAPPGSTLLVGLLLVGFAALSPAALLWMLPTFEAAVLAQFHGGTRAPFTAASNSVERSVYHLGMRRIWREQSRDGDGPARSVMVLGPGTQVFIRPPRPRPAPPAPDTEAKRDAAV